MRIHPLSITKRLATVAAAAVTHRLLGRSSIKQPTIDRPSQAGFGATTSPVRDPPQFLASSVASSFVNIFVPSSERRHPLPPPPSPSKGPLLLNPNLAKLSRFYEAAPTSHVAVARPWPEISSTESEATDHELVSGTLGRVLVSERRGFVRPDFGVDCPASFVAGAARPGTSPPCFQRRTRWRPWSRYRRGLRNPAILSFVFTSGLAAVALAQRPGHSSGLRDGGSVHWAAYEGDPQGPAGLLFDRHREGCRGGLQPHFDEW